jgi:hypothetical protein
MAYEDDPHLTDEDLLLAADGESTSRRQSEVRAHLSSCWTCRARMTELEATIAEFVHGYHSELDPQIPTPEGPSALLRATLAQRTGSADGGRWFTFLPALPQPNRLTALFAVAACSVTIAVMVLIGKLPSGGIGLWRFQPIARAEPDANLTPGATRPISKTEVCEAGEPGTFREVPVALQNAVFREYGIAHPQVRAYEVDYLITPELGGASDIRNLWPEPYYTTVWNAHVKDALERRLREMVCHGDLDLEAAQHDLSADWIAAYKKYFHTDRPLVSDALFTTNGHE